MQLTFQPITGALPRRRYFQKRRRPRRLSVFSFFIGSSAVATSVVYAELLPYPLIRCHYGPPLYTPGLLPRSPLTSRSPSLLTLVFTCSLPLVLWFACRPRAVVRAGRAVQRPSSCSPLARREQ